MKVVALPLAALLWIGGASAQTASPALTIVAAENFYGDIAGQVAGPGVPVTSILSNPDQDPHLFAASPSTARALADARIVVMNGVDYDPWMAKLLGAARKPQRAVVDAGSLLRRKAGVNPHLWYDPATMPVVATAVSQALSAADPAHAADYAQRLADVKTQLKRIDDKLADMRRRFAGQAVTATEPVFGYAAAAAGLTMRNERFQLSVMNNTEPRASDVAAFERDLKNHAVRVLIYNSQATGGTAKRMVQIAQQNNVPVIGVTETEPPGSSFVPWMLGELEALDKALGTPTP